MDEIAYVRLRGDQMSDFKRISVGFGVLSRGGMSALRHGHFHPSSPYIKSATHFALSFPPIMASSSSS